jgi:hypothetical protein
MSQYSPNSYVRIPDMKVFHATENAIVVCRATVDRRSSHYDRESFWVPNQFLDHDENELAETGDTGDLVIPRWIADKNDITNWDYID